MFDFIEQGDERLEEEKSRWLRIILMDGDFSEEEISAGMDESGWWGDEFEPENQNLKNEEEIDLYF